MKDRFFSKLDWAAFWTATLITFVIYFCTLGPSVGLEDSGELATAGAHLGVPHPPGYPFWTLCSWIFCKLFSFVTYMGHPTPAWCISLFSATAGAFAAGFTAMLICRSSYDFLHDAEKPSRSALAIAFGGGVAGALTFSLSPVEWSQSTIVEIYSLNAFFLMWVFLLTYRWMRKPSDRILWLTMFVFGLGLTNYQVLLFAVVPLVLVIMMTNIRLFRDIATFLIPVALSYQVLKIGQLGRASSEMACDVISKHAPLVDKAVSTPSSALVAVAVVVLVVALVVAAWLRRRQAAEKAIKVALGGGLAAAEKAIKVALGGGLAAAAVMILAILCSSPVTWSGVCAETAPLVMPWKYVVIAALISASVGFAAAAALVDGDWKADPRAMKYIILAGVLAVVAVGFAATAVPEADAAGYHGVPYPWGKSTLIMAVLVLSLLGLGLTTRRGLAFAIPVVGLQLAVFTLLRHGAMNGLTYPGSWWFGWAVAWNFIMLALAVLALPNGRTVAISALATQLGAAFYAYMPIVSDLRNPPMNWGYPRTWEGFKHAIMRGQYEAIGIPSFGSFKEFCSFMEKQVEQYFLDVRVQFTDLLIPFAVVPFVVGHWLVVKVRRRAFWQWMLAAFACFFMMSFLLMLLANVRGDIQDGFIQKVKFISSHAMIALWVGYGLVFVAAFVLRFVAGPARRTLAIAMAVVMVAVAGFYPVWQNWHDDQMVFELGGCEQNGHTFGWQFGAYSLDGAKAIRSQLTADEEPLPDPDYPPAMEPFSIFFGGTDPGRFVPTYMIYSADYRPDVYLITQNALADDTYMSVERDLYGDEIWIPSKEDSAEAFNVYVDEVQRGVRPANGDLRIENGRVQVTGALGVMEINGILTKMMFDHDRLRHRFYVEESYVIPWMYPYLSPHGLVMRLNADASPYDREAAMKDMDFWDWYYRRLVADGAYRRDFAAQKSFSKLRSAIAGLYVQQSRYYQAAQAYREACILYPISPEANFRYIQECLLPFRAEDVVLEMLDFTDLMDERNHRTQGIRKWILDQRVVREKLETLQPKLRDHTITKPEIFELAMCFDHLGRIREAAELMKMVADQVTAPDSIRAMADIFLEGGMKAEAETALGRYLRLKPNSDAIAWCRLAKLQWTAGKSQSALASFEQAIAIDSKAVQALLVKDSEKDLYELYLAWRRQLQSYQSKQRRW